MKIRARYPSTYTHELPPWCEQSHWIKHSQDCTPHSSHQLSWQDLCPQRVAQAPSPSFCAHGECPELSFSVIGDQAEK